MSNDGYLQSVKKQFSYYKALAEKNFRTTYRRAIILAI